MSKNQFKNLNSEQTSNIVEKEKLKSCFQNLFKENSSALFDNPFLFSRTGLISKLLLLSKLYKKIINVPGDIIEFGIWFGQTLIILENLRAIHETFNITRKFYGFDTFDGYKEISGLDIQKDEIEKYKLVNNWENELSNIFQLHSSINNSKTNLEIIKGDVLKTIPSFYKKYQGPVAFCYIDIATYETTKLILENTIPIMSKGAIIVIDDFGIPYPGVQDALSDHKVFVRNDLETKICPYYPTKLYITKK